MRYSLLALALLIGAAPAVMGQSAAHRYEPLEVGYEWEYEDVFGPYPDRPYVSRLERWVILADTLIEGRRYFVDERQSYTVRFGVGGVHQGPVLSLIRFDEARAHLVRWDGTADVDFGLACPLNAASGSVVECVGGFQMLVAQEGARKSFSDFIGLHYISYYRRDVGMESDGGEDLMTRLYYARVGPAESFGTPRFMSAVAAEPRPAGSDTVIGDAYPNPAREVFAVSIQSAIPGRAEVDAFDLLGRHVATATRSVGMGRERLEMQSASWAPGLYLLRVRLPDGSTSTRRVVRAD